MPYLRKANAIPRTVPGTPDAPVPHQALPSDVSVLVEVHIAVRGGGGPLAEVDERCAPVGESEQHETASAEVACVRFGDSQCHADRDRSVDGVAPLPEHLDANLRCMPFRSDDHGLCRVDRLGPEGRGLRHEKERARPDQVDRRPPSQARRRSRLRCAGCLPGTVSEPAAVHGIAFSIDVSDWEHRSCRPFNFRCEPVSGQIDGQLLISDTARLGRLDADGLACHSG